MFDQFNNKNWDYSYKNNSYGKFLISKSINQKKMRTIDVLIEKNSLSMTFYNIYVFVILTSNFINLSRKKFDWKFNI
jgi:hypothetical protein